MNRILQYLRDLSIFGGIFLTVLAAIFLSAGNAASQSSNPKPSSSQTQVVILGAGTPAENKKTGISVSANSGLIN